MKNKEISVLISSCDRYEDVWVPYFFFFKKNWDCPYRIYLNTETKKCTEEGVITLNHKADASWSKRLKSALKKIDSEYIIFLLEDFFFLDRVNQEAIDTALETMKKDRTVSVIDFDPRRKIGSSQPDRHGYIKKDLSSKYYLNCQAALWRRKDLIKYISPYENPWQFELYGSDRAKLYNKIFLMSCQESQLPFKYDVDRESGYGLYGGKWLRSNVGLFRENGLSVDFERLGFHEGQKVRVSRVVPKKCFKDRWMYLLYGGGEKIRMGIFEQIKFAFLHPRRNLTVIKSKLIYLFTDKRAL